MIRLVLFDIDGTLIHTSGAGEKAFARVFSNFFGIADGTEKLKFAGRTDASILREFFVHNAIEPSPENMEQFFDAYVFLLEHMLQTLPGTVHPGVSTWLNDLRALPHPPVIGLLTGNIRLGAEIKLRRFHLWGEFATGAFADDSSERNEIAAIAKRRGEHLLGKKLRGDEVLVIGDTPLDIACARAIGAKVLAVGTGMYRPKDLLPLEPDWAVINLEQLSAHEVCA
ncbi:MAG TPA: HAD hydrolase-like protein [Candidatus Limnocylindria bacterium]|nr:HAD hydrolase-like protein [Candidatus Limnocylindria bacterium]